MTNEQKPKNAEVPAAAAKPAEAQGTKVVIKDLSWVSAGDFHSKQQSDSADDSMGTFQPEVVLVGPDGKNYQLRTGGESTNVVHPFQRRILSLLVACIECARTIKGGYYLDSLSLNLEDDDAKFLGRLTKEGWSLDWVYGGGKNKVHSYAPVASLMAAAEGLMAVRNSTLEKYPPEKAANAPVIDRTKTVVVETVL